MTIQEQRAGVHALSSKRIPFAGGGRFLALALIAGLAVFLVATPGGLVDRDGMAAADSHEDKPVMASIQIKKEVKIADFLKILSAYTRTPILWNPKDKNINNKVIQGSMDLSGPKEDIFALSRALLTFYELAMVPIGPSEYNVQLVMDVKQSGSILKLKPEFVTITDENYSTYEDQDGRFITTTIKVENMSDLRNARTAVSKIVTGSSIGQVTEVPQAKSFVVTDFAPNVVAIYRLLKAMDVKPPSSEVSSTYFELEHATAEELEPILTELFTGGQRVGQPTARGRNQPATAGIDVDPEPRLISDPRTNTIIVYATARDVKEIGEVIRKLDVAVYITRDRVHVYRLKNLEAGDTAEVLTSLIEAASIFGKDSGTSANANRAGRPAGRVNPDQVDPREEDKPAVVADDKSNSLIIAGTKRQFEELKKVLLEIDVQKDQVLIEAALIELTLEDSYRLAFELGVADDNGLVNTDKASGFGFTNYGNQVFTDKDGDTFFTDRIPAFVDSDASLAPRGLVGGIFAFGQVPLMFNVANSVSRTRILQLPSLVTADNEEAFIQVQDEQSFSESNASSGGAIGTGFGGFAEAGTTLRISPQIADQNYLLLNINLEVSAFDGEPRTLPDGSQIPADRIRRTLQTSVVVPDRHTVVLGGLMGRTQTSTDERVPGVADIPILGELFKSTSKRDRETSLFLFVTPTIMHGKDSFDVLDIESCRRKQKADELIGFTEIYNTKFVGCEQQDAATGVYTGEGAVGATYESVGPGCVRGSGSASGSRGGPNGSLPSAGDASGRMQEIGLLEATRFHGVDPQRIRAERNARRAALRAPAVRRGSQSARRGSRTGRTVNQVRTAPRYDARTRSIAPQGAGQQPSQPRVVQPVKFKVGPNNRVAPGTEAGFMGSASSPGLAKPRGYWKTSGT